MERIEGHRITAYAVSRPDERWRRALRRGLLRPGGELGGVTINKKTNLKDEGRRALLAEFNQCYQGPDKVIAGNISTAAWT